jgi:hypothetical protein
VNAETTAWIVALTGVVGILSGLIGQALYWGIFKGSIEARTLATEGQVTELKQSRSEMWTEINAHGERLATVEAALNINRALKAKG